MRETRNTLIQLQLKAVLLLFIIPCFVLWTGLGFYWLLDEHEYYFQINKQLNSYKTQQSGYSYQDQQFSINNQKIGNVQYQQQQKNQNECLSKANQAIITFWLLMSMIVIFVYFIAIIGYVYELIKESGNAQVVEFNDYRQVNQRNRRRVGESDINGVGEHQQMIYLQASLRHVRNRMNGRLENGVNRVHIDSQNYLRQIDRYAFEAGLNSFERDEIPVYEYQSNQYVSEKQVNPSLTLKNLMLFNELNPNKDNSQNSKQNNSQSDLLQNYASTAISSTVIIRNSDLESNQNNLNTTALDNQASSQHNNQQQDLCAICFGDYQHGQIVRSMPVCCHKFHKECIDTWLKITKQINKYVLDS